MGFVFMSILTTFGFENKDKKNITRMSSLFSSENLIDHMLKSNEASSKA